MVAKVQDTAQERTRGQNDRATGDDVAVLGFDCTHGAGLNLNVRSSRLNDLQLRPGRELGLHGGAVKGAITLGARALNGRTFPAIEQTELDTGGICGPAHRAIQRIDFAHQMAFAEAADSGVAGHLSDTVEAVGQEACSRAHSGCG